MVDVLPPGARCVLIDAGIVPVSITASEIGRDFWFKAGPAGDALDGDTFTTTRHEFAGRAMRPYAPAHVRAARLPSGDVELRWIRRTRVGGDSWHLNEVPLGEEIELYAVDILDEAGEVKRSIASEKSRAVYEVGMQTADFGVPVTELTVVVYQVSATYGRGAGRRVTIHV